MALSFSTKSTRLRMDSSTSRAASAYAPFSHTRVTNVAPSSIVANERGITSMIRSSAPG